MWSALEAKDELVTRSSSVKRAMPKMASCFARNSKGSQPLHQDCWVSTTMREFASHSNHPLGTSQTRHLAEHGRRVTGESKSTDESLKRTSLHRYSRHRVAFSLVFEGSANGRRLYRFYRVCEVREHVPNDRWPPTGEFDGVIASALARMLLQAPPSAIAVQTPMDRAEASLWQARCVKNVLGECPKPPYCRAAQR